jgi:CHAT domain-containing protein
VRLVSDPTVVIQPGTVAIADSLNTASFFTSAGSVWVDAAGSILGTATANINGSSFLQGGNITFRSGDSIQFLGVLATGAVAGASGTVDLAAKNNLAFGSIETINLNAGTGGAVMLTSLLGSVTGGKVWTFGENTGGDLTVKAYQSIDLGEVFTFGTIGNAGFVKLDPIGDIVVKSIDARGGTSGRGGNVVIITDRYFRATEPISGTAFSILTSGGAGGGSITIQHGGGLLDTPFTIGDAILNGTFGDISTGGFMLNAGQTLRESFMSGNIQVTTSVPPVVPPIGMPPIGMPPIDIAPIVPVPIEPVNPVSVTHSTGMATATLSPSAASAEVTAFDQRPTDSASATSNTGNSDSPASFEVDSFEVERTFTRQYEQHLGITPPTPIKSIQEIRQRTIELNRSTGKKTAFIYVEFKDKQVKLTLITAQSTTARVAPTNEATVLATAKTLIKTVSDRKPRQHYLPPSQQLYNWLIKPLSSQLAAEKIQNLIFIVDEGLRSLPFAALHDGQSFLVERYSLSLMPTYSLVSRNQSELTIKNSVLAMGASQFEFLTPLPAVPWELEMVTQAFPNLPQDKQFFNQAFTRQALRNQLLSQPYGVVHLATHTLVEPGDISNSYIQFTDGRLRLSDLDKDATLWQRVNLLVLSACNTALDDRQAEMGFAGIAIKSGVRSTLASLWRVDDVGTLVLMQQFYQALQQEPPLIAEALQQAQIAMLKGKARFSRQLLRSSSAPTPDQLSLRLKSSELEGLRDHPYYWAAFTLIGQPR